MSALTIAPDLVHLHDLNLSIRHTRYEFAARKVLRARGFQQCATCGHFVVRCVEVEAGDYCSPDCLTHAHIEFHADWRNDGAFFGKVDECERGACDLLFAVGEDHEGYCSVECFIADGSRDYATRAEEQAEREALNAAYLAENAEPDLSQDRAVRLP